MKNFRLLMLISLLTTLTICCGLQNTAFASATGTIGVNISTDGNGKITSVHGSATLFSDDTYWWNIYQWVGDYAQVDCFVDGVIKKRILEFNLTHNGYDDVRDHTEKTFSWWPSGW
ncbi:MAG: hypothetical protein DRG82_06585 [Deltaproteobacteria bacterium]|nr:MAG: hypothetical protein DRG82_06585 [Deltaproteobacteria bacterium]